uniref:Lon protease homolog, mitochondrial n=1 Tax=Amphora coffeiformis TaxID=265554 RepID=A0A7S3P6J3_9STRA|eukprot:scaffold11094_cov176-Amphora_coffeaeformis.AAC.2
MILRSLLLHRRITSRVVVSSSSSSSSFLPSWSVTAASCSTSGICHRRSYHSNRWLLDNSADNNNNNNSNKGSSVVLPSPTSVVLRDQAPRFPHTLALPLVSRPIFPGLVTSVTLTDPATIAAMEELQVQTAETSTHGGAYLSAFLRQQHSTGVTSDGTLLATPEVITDPEEIYSVGTFCQIQRLTRHGNTGDPNNKESASSSSASATLLLLAHRRVHLESVDNVGPPIDVTVKHWKAEATTTAAADDGIRALTNEVISTIREIAQVNPLFRENLQFFPMRVDANNPHKLADFCASIAAAGTPADLQQVLEEPDAEQRLHLALVLLNREREVSKLQREISAKVEEKMTEAQRKYFLQEQLKSIKKELGMEKDDKDAIIAKYRQQLSEYPAVPEEVMEVIESELDKFASLEKNSPEFQVTRSYLDWLTAIPWGVETEENFDLQQARAILDRDHYGLDDVKDTILQFIAIGKLVGSVQGKILCLSGPPGTGKTSIAKSVAASLGREFYRFSVGGLSDVSEIKGHRRTYIGAMPGKIMQCLKATKTSNPVVLIDEIDKLGTGFRGDPASALLEVLDPSQNSTFRDHFLDVPVDISKVLFICTANDLERIPGPLLDRMEVIRLSGYDFPEKVAIAEQYLVPKSLKESGLMVEKKANEGKDASEGGSDGTDKSEDKKKVERKTTPLESYVHAEKVPNTLSVTTEAIQSLVRWYAREAGVRNLSKYIDKITRKLALQVVAEEEGTELRSKTRRKSDTWQVTPDNLSDYVGKPIFTSDRLYQDGPLPPGIIMGLAYTSMGGSALYIETQGIKKGLDADGKVRGGGTLKVTGQLGDVMKESSQIALTVARAIYDELQPGGDFFDTNDIHMHVPEGATPKDGPSAGITMVTSMLSLALNKPVPNDLAMTGEVSLTGKVLAVGGIKEKIMGARRSGITTVVLPKACDRDFDEIPDYLKEGLTVHYADDYKQVYEVCFGSTK